MWNNSSSRFANRGRGSSYSSARPMRQRSGAPKRFGTYIHPSKFVNKAAIVAEQVAYEPTHSFADFNVHHLLKRNIVDRGYESPTPVQDQSIQPILDGKDLIGLANTGTGKTAAFLIPIINRLCENGGRGLVLIMAPTRELAVQIDQEFRQFGMGLRLYSALCVGGASLHRQIMALSRRPQFVIGTPGRLRDLVEQGALHLGLTSVLVLDEADRMLDMGFSKDIHFLVDLLPKQRQSLCFSATMDSTVERLVREILIDPVKVSVRTSETSDHVEQDVIRADSKEQKMTILSDLLRKPGFEKVLIFGQTKHGVQRLADDISKFGFKTEAIHGNKSQGQRQRALDAFKANRVQVLVATDVAARGLDIPNVTHVINFDQPSTFDDYIHRIGRTGRAGNQGNALTFVPSH